MNQTKVYVIGGGPAGIMAAVKAAQDGAEVTLVEKNQKLGKKLFITGKGRCNVTNNCETENFFASIAHNPKFCYSALYSFTPQDTIELIEKNGTPLKTERGLRVFPQSDKSSDIIKAFEVLLKKSGVNVMLDTKLEDIFVQEGKISGIKLSGKVCACDKLILALGGASYASTGSDGAWKKMLEKLGHTVEEFSPALVPLKSNEKLVCSLQGLSLKNVTLKAFEGKRRIFEELGEMLFTHFGISGPLVLSLSSRIKDFSALKVYIDLKPALTREVLDARLLRDFTKYGSKTLKNAMQDLLPSRLIFAVISKAELDENMPISNLTAQQRQALVEVLKGFEVKVSGFGELNEAIITRGGISVKQIDSSTMQSKLISNLYFAGEMIDIDAYTGGFNIQLALSTGFLAGASVQGEI